MQRFWYECCLCCKNKFLMHFKSFFVTSALFLLVITGCTSTENINITDWEPLPEKSQTAVAAQNKFAFKVFDLINRKNQAGENLLISPLSIYMDLSMVFNGADGATRAGIKKALQLNDIPASLLNETNHLLLKNLPHADPDVEIDIANSIWYRHTFTPLSSFLTTNKKFYKAKIEGADFSNKQTVTDINNWVKESTRGKIDAIMEHIEPGDIMFLLNAVYFNGAWTHSFNAKQTRDRDFHTGAGDVKKVPFMFQKNRYNFYQNDDIQVVELPYGNGHFSMYILLPAKNSDLQSLISSFDLNSFAGLSDRMDTVNLNLHLPKWEASYKINNLAPELSQMGMENAFTKKADFTGMYKNRDAKISQVRHKTYIKVNERGTEAAAVTSTGIRTTAATINPPPSMDINRPFLYLIKENSSGSIFFLGTVNDPEKKD